MLARRRWLFGIVALFPIVVIFAWVRLYPIEETLRMSLHEWNLISKVRPFIGFANFRELFGDKLFLTSLFNTTFIAFGTLAITVPVGMVIAGLIHYRFGSRLAGWFETGTF